MSKVITDASQPTDFSQFALSQNFGAQVKVISGQSLAGKFSNAGQWCGNPPTGLLLHDRGWNQGLCSGT